MELFFTTLLCIFLSSIFLISIHLGLSHKSNPAAAAAPPPPGKTGWPVIGESLEYISGGWKGHPEKFIMDRMSKYSSAIFRTSLFGENFAVFCGPAGNKFLFSNEYKLLKGWWPKTMDKIFPNSTSSSSDGTILMRKMLATVLRAEALHRYIPVMDTIARRHFAGEWEDRERVTVFPLTKNYTFWIACHLFVSMEDPDQFRKFRVRLNCLIAGLFSMPIDFPGTPFWKAIKVAKSIRKDLVAIIRRRKIELAEGKASPTQDILSLMVVYSDESGKSMTELDIADKIMGLLMAGHDTTSSACAFIVKYLAELPHVYDGVYKEQMEIAKSKGDGDQLLNWEDLGKMKYSWNVACEVLRLVPPLQGTFREAIVFLEAIVDFVYNGFSIPKGRKLFWNVYSTHKNSEFFPQPEQFDPSRFEGSGPAPYAYVPFGGGPRMCPGKEYARLEILVFMHHLVKRFRWENLIPDEKIMVDPVAVPAKGLPIKLYPHPAN